MWVSEVGLSARERVRGICVSALCDGIGRSWLTLEVEQPRLLARHTEPPELLQ